VISADLIGREDELGRLGRVLRAHHAGVVIVSGSRGVGRHALVDAACRQTASWRLMPPAGLGLYVEPRTTPDGFAQRLRQAIGIPPAAPPESAGGDAARPSPSDPVQLAAALAELAPVVLILERYRPQRSMDRWLVDALMPALRDAGVAAVLAILDPPEDVTRLTTAAADHIALAALDPDAIRPEVAEAMSAVRPPLTEAELELYVSGIAERPGVFDSLLRLLAVPIFADDAAV
jgi:hypothetical protein